MFDRNWLLLYDLKRWSAIVPAIIGTVVNFALLFAQLGDPWSAVLTVVASAIAATVLAFALLVALLRIWGTSRLGDDYVTLSSIDEYLLESKGKALYRRTVGFRTRIPTADYLTAAPLLPKGLCRPRRAFFRSDPLVQYRVETRRFGSKSMVKVTLPHMLDRNARIDDLCIEYEMTDAFLEDQEGVAVEAVPRQKVCILRVSFDGQVEEPQRLQWRTYLGDRLIERDSGRLRLEKPPRDGWAPDALLVERDFSECLRDVEMRCEIVWEWPTRSGEEALAEG